MSNTTGTVKSKKKSDLKKNVFGFL